METPLRTKSLALMFFLWVHFPVQIMVSEKLDRGDLQRLSRDIGNIAGREIYESFVRGDMTTMRGSRLRPHN